MPPLTRADASSAKARSEREPRSKAGIAVELPGRSAIVFDCLLLDFNGTLACDGRLLPGVAPRLRLLSRVVDVEVVTADTFGTVRTALAKLPVRIRQVRTGRGKRGIVSNRRVVAVGNGTNDLALFAGAALRIAVIGPEGASVQALRAADVAVTAIVAALDLLLHPQRLTATLRK